MCLQKFNNCFLYNPWKEFNVVAGFTTKGITGENILDSLEKICSELGINNCNIAYLKQVHGKEVFIADELIDQIFVGDGLITKLDNKLLIVKTADCVPVFIFDKINSIISILHAGWKSAHAGIIANALKKFSSASNLEIFIGPCLRKECFEVQNDFLVNTTFLSFISKMHFDLVGFIKYELMQKGVLEKNIFDSEFCSICNNELFYSFRKEKYKHLRTLSFIGKIFQGKPSQVRHWQDL